MNPWNETERLPSRSRKSTRVGEAWLDTSIECSAVSADLFDIALTLRAVDGPLCMPALRERYVAVSLHASHPRYAPRILAGSEIARLTALLAAGEARAAAAAAPPGRKLPRLRWPSIGPRPQRVAAVFALLALLFPGVAFIPIAAHADDGGGVTTPPIVTTPVGPRTPPSTGTAPTDTTTTTPTDTTTTDTTTTDTTTTDTTTTDTTTTATTATETTPTTTAPIEIVPRKTHPPAIEPPVSTTTAPTPTAPTTAAKSKLSKPKVAAKPKSKKKKKAAAATVTAPTLTLPDGLDPTPPSLRLNAAFAADLTVVAARAHVDWALLLGTIRAQGNYGNSPVSEPALEDLATRLSALGSNAAPHTAVVTMLGSDARTNRALALSNYYQAVGLPALVHGLKWAKPSLERKVLADPRVHIYPGGIGDIKSDKVDVRVIATIEYLAQTYDEVTVSCLISGHGLYARPGVISAHIFGLAVDISALKNIPIAGHQHQGGITESAVRSILMLPPEMQPNQVISLLNLGGPSFALSNHWDHIHIGFAPAPLVVPGTQSNVQEVPPVSGSLLHLWQSAGATYGVPWQVLAAINKIESNFGRNMGPSSAGAIGWMQFMPSTWSKWGVDANGDGIANPWEPADSIYAAARYLAAAGARKNLPRAIYAYNHAQWYVNEVLQLASLFGNQGAGSLAGLYAPSTFTDEDVTTTKESRDLTGDPPFSLMAQWAMGTEERMEPDLLSRWIDVFANFVGSAQKTVPGPVLTWLRRGGTIFQTLAAEQTASRSLAITYDPAIRGQLQSVLAPPQAARGLASVSATRAFDKPSTNSTGTP